MTIDGISMRNETERKIEYLTRARVWMSRLFVSFQLEKREKIKWEIVSGIFERKFLLERRDHNLKKKKKKKKGNRSSFTFLLPLFFYFEIKSFGEIFHFVFEYFFSSNWFSTVSFQFFLKRQLFWQKFNPMFFLTAHRKVLFRMLNIKQLRFHLLLYLFQVDLIGGAAPLSNDWQMVSTEFFNRQIIITSQIITSTFHQSKVFPHILFSFLTFSGLLYLLFSFWIKKHFIHSSCFQAEKIVCET